MKRILVTGTGSSGSWKIRGQQLGEAIGADVVPLAKSVAGYDLVVVVKRGEAELFELIKRAGVPMVWDIVDAWPQPHGNLWDKSRAIDWLKNCLNSIRPAAVVAPTPAMALDVSAFHPRVVCIEHHARPDQERNPIRERMEVAGYEGSEQYMRALGPNIVKLCDDMGLRFVMNPPKLCALDVVIAMRDDRGYPVTSWKSNVKLANAQATGTPCVVNTDMGYVCSSVGGEIYADDIQELRIALETLRPFKQRLRNAELLLSADTKLISVAARYASWLESL